MIANPSLKRLFVEFSLQTGGQGCASDKQYHYLADVLRMQEREKILLFNGRDGEWEGYISYKPGKALVFKVIKQRRSQPPNYDLHYFFSPLKAERLDYIIQKAVEMGVGTIRPVITHYTQARITNMRRLRANAISAAEQCGILTIPHIDDPEKWQAIGNTGRDKNNKPGNSHRAGRWI